MAAMTAGRCTVFISCSSARSFSAPITVNGIVLIVFSVILSDFLPVVLPVASCSGQRHSTALMPPALSGDQIQWRRFHHSMQSLQPVCAQLLHVRHTYA